MAKYRTVEEMRGILSDDEITALTNKAKSNAYMVTDTLVNYSGDEWSPDVMAAFANLAMAIQADMPDSDVRIKGTAITRRKTDAEIESDALQAEASTRYYAEQQAEKGE